MAFRYGWRGPTIVSDGLILYLDAGSPNSYRTDFGTTWKDISGRGKTGILTGGAVYDSAGSGSIYFDGSDDYVDVSGTETISSSSVCVWGRTPGLASYAGIVFNRGSGNNIGGLTQYTGVARIQYGWNDNNSGDTAGGTLNISLNTWQMWSFTHTPLGSNNRTVYVNTTGSSITTAGLTSMTWSSLRIGNDSFSSARSFSGNIAVVLWYNRQLSSTEIAQNYNALRGRFGV